jgi:hypothetical protein
MIKMYTDLHVIFIHYSSHILMKIACSQQIYKNHESSSIGSRVVPRGRTDVYDEANSLFLQFCVCAQNGAANRLTASGLSVCSKPPNNHCRLDVEQAVDITHTSPRLRVLYCYVKTVAYRGVNPLPKFRSFDKAEPNSQFRGNHIRNNLKWIRGFTQLHIERNPWLGGYRPHTPVLTALNWICCNPPPPTKFLGTPLRKNDTCPEHTEERNILRLSSVTFRKRATIT